MKKKIKVLKFNDRLSKWEPFCCVFDKAGAVDWYCSLGFIVQHI